MPVPKGTKLKVRRWRVDLETGCHIWLLYPGRYGRDSRNGKSVSAHRAAYEREFGEIPDGKQIDHLCKNTLCVNPYHLEVVDPAENIRRSSIPTITMDIARQIRSEHTGKRGSQRRLAEKFNVHATVVSKIINNKYWRELS